MKWWRYVIGALVGGLAVSLLFLLCNWEWNFSLNVVDFAMLLATIILSIVVVFLTKRLENKDIIRNIIIEDLNILCDLYQQNSGILTLLSDEKIAIESARDKINMQFFKADLQIDRINKELAASFASYYKNNKMQLEQITSSYFKWLTGGSFMESRFSISSSFIKEHEIQLNNTVSDIKVVVHKLVAGI